MVIISTSVLFVIALGKDSGNEKAKASRRAAYVLGPTDEKARYTASDTVAIASAIAYERPFYIVVARSPSDRNSSPITLLLSRK